MFVGLLAVLLGFGLLDGFLGDVMMLLGDAACHQSADIGFGACGVGLQQDHLFAQVGDVVAHEFQHFVEHVAFAHLLVGIAVRALEHRQGAVEFVVLEVRLEHPGCYLAFLGDDAQLFGEVLELADIAAPVVVLQELFGVLGERDAGDGVLVGEVGDELAEEQGDIVLAFAQCGHMDLDAAEAVVEVLAETSLADGVRQVEVGGCDDAHVGLADCGLAHADIFAGLEHTQEHGLGVKGQFAHFVEEEGAAVGFFEIALAVAAGVGVGALDMTEQFRVDRPRRESAAVHRQTRSVLARRVVVDDTAEDVLAHAVLTRDEYAQVGLGDLDGHLDVVHQLGRRPDNAVPLFDIQYLLLRHVSVFPLFWGCKVTKYFSIMQGKSEKSDVLTIFMPQNLHMSEKSCNFAPQKYAHR